MSGSSPSLQSIEDAFPAVKVPKYFMNTREKSRHAGQESILLAEIWKQPRSPSMIRGFFTILVFSTSFGFRLKGFHVGMGSRFKIANDA